MPETRQVARIQDRKQFLQMPNVCRVARRVFVSRLIPTSFFLFGLLFTSNSMAQRVFEKDRHVIYEDAHKNRNDLGIGFSPVRTASGKVAVIRGASLNHNDAFDCGDKDKKNWISLYDPIRHDERVLFDEPVHFDDVLVPSGYCIFDQVNLSSDQRTLYLVSPVYATSGKLAIINLRRKTTTYVDGVNSVYIIESGPHRGELIYSARRYKRSPYDNIEYPYYPFIHARPN